jgi:hypothetical protein
MFARATVHHRNTAPLAIHDERTRQLLQPVNEDGTSAFRRNSIVPVRFRVADADGHSIGTAGVVTDFRLIRTIQGEDITEVDEAVDSSTSHTEFRWDAKDEQWVFNLSTRNLRAGFTYVYQITLDAGTTIEFQFGLR